MGGNVEVIGTPMEGRTFGVFPVSWGTPPGAQFSPERAEWVRERVATLVAARRSVGAVEARGSSPDLAGIAPLEFTEQQRTNGVFPAEWGTPPGDRYGEKRAAWVRERVGEYVATRKVQAKAAEIAAARSIAERRKYLDARRHGPVMSAVWERRIQLMRLRYVPGEW